MLKLYIYTYIYVASIEYVDECMTDALPLVAPCMSCSKEASFCMGDA